MGKLGRTVYHLRDNKVAFNDYQPSRLLWATTLSRRVRHRNDESLPWLKDSALLALASASSSDDLVSERPWVPGGRRPCGSTRYQVPLVVHLDLHGFRVLVGPGRLRPQVCSQVCEAAGNPEQAATPVAAARAYTNFPGPSATPLAAARAYTNFPGPSATPLAAAWTYTNFPGHSTDRCQYQGGAWESPFVVPSSLVAELILALPPLWRPKIAEAQSWRPPLPVATVGRFPRNQPTVATPRSQCETSTTTTSVTHRQTFNSVICSPLCEKGSPGAF